MSDHPFAGFDRPQQNYSKLPHAFIDAAHLFSSQAEVMVVLYILRHTWGFSEYDQPKKITLDEFEHGRKTAKGERIDNGCGMSRRSIQRGLADAEAHGFINIETDDSDKARLKRWYSIRMAGVSDVSVRGVNVAPQSGQDNTPEVSDVSRDQRKKPKKETKGEKAEPAPNGAVLPAHLKNMQLQNTGMPLYSAYLAAYEELNLKAPLMRRRDDTVYEVEGLLTGKFTPEQVKAFCIEKLKVKPNYHFRFLSEDLPGWVNTKAKPATKPHTMSPAAAEPDDAAYLTPDAFRKLKEAQQ